MAYDASNSKAVLQALKSLREKTHVLDQQRAEKKERMERLQTELEREKAHNAEELYRLHEETARSGNQLQEERARLVAERTRLGQEKSELHEEIHRMKSQFMRMGEEVRHLRGQIDGAREETDMVNNKAAAAEAQLDARAREADHQVHAVKRRQHDLEDSLYEYQSRIAVLEAQIEDERTLKQTLEEEVGTGEETVRRLLKLNEDLMSKLGDATTMLHQAPKVVIRELPPDFSPKKGKRRA